MFTPTDQSFMSRALELAQRGLYTAHPNPRVGCLLVSEGVVVGEGWHRKAGEPHAEVEAIRQAGTRAQGSTAYVTLEPCCHYGRTPPCTEALIKAGVTQVVVATEDPNPFVSGKGIQMLNSAGIVVSIGLLGAEARALNAGFIKRMSSGLPFVRVKLAASLDGRTALANGVSQWISCSESRADVQRWRARSSAIITGVGTVLADDPQLTVRDTQIELLGRQPLRVICDSRLRTPRTAHVVQTEGTLIYSLRESQNLVAAEVKQVAADDKEEVDLLLMLRDLAARGCNEVLVEAGATLCGRLFELRLVDELLLYVAPMLLGQDARSLLRLPIIDSMDQRIPLDLIEMQQIGSDIRLRYQVKG